MEKMMTKIILADVLVFILYLVCAAFSCRFDRQRNSQALFHAVILLLFLSIVFVQSFYDFAHSSSAFPFCTTMLLDFYAL